MKSDEKGGVVESKEAKAGIVDLNINFTVSFEGLSDEEAGILGVSLGRLLKATLVSLFYK